MENPQPYPVYRRGDLLAEFIKAVSTAFNMMFVQHLEVPYLWHYKRDAFSVLENQGQSSVQFLERDELWQLYTLGLKFRAIHARCDQITTMWGKIKARKPEAENVYLTNTLLASVCMMSIEAAAEGYEWLSYHYPEEIKAIKEEESLEEGVKRLPERSAQDDVRQGPISQLVKVSEQFDDRFVSDADPQYDQAFGINVSQIAVTFNDAEGVPVPPSNPEKLPMDLAEEYSGSGTYFIGAVDALAGEHAIRIMRIFVDNFSAASQIITTEFAKDPSIKQQARDFIEACGVVTVTPTERGMNVIDQYHLYYVR